MVLTGKCLCQGNPKGTREVRNQEEVPVKSLHLTGGFVLDCVTDDPKPFAATVIVEDGKIAAIHGEGHGPPPPSMTEVKTMDVGGRFLLPGLWESHCHPGGMTPDPHRVSLFETEAERALRAARNTMAAIGIGVTALRSAGEASFIDVALREAFANEHPTGPWQADYADKPLIGPRMFCAGRAIGITGGHGANRRVESRHVAETLEADGADEVRKATRFVIKMGVDWVKLLITGGIAGIRESMGECQMTFEEIKAACDVAHAKGLKVGAHTGSAVAAKLAVSAGLDVVEHGYQLDQEACEMMAERGVYYCPTLSVTHAVAFKRRWPGYPEHSLRRAIEGAEAHRRALQHALSAGVNIVNGADLNPIADTARSEIEWVVKAGMSPAQALIASTRRPAELCGVEDILGTVEVGKLADLIVINKNPLEDISALRDVHLVLKEGEILVDRLTG
jgi:imidazolonepropionase-like amidohydrolase